MKRKKYNGQYEDVTNGYVKQYDEMPTTPHFVIIHYETMTSYSGYSDRSGVADTSTEHVIKYEAFDREDEWIAEIKKLTLASNESSYYSRKRFHALRVTPAKIGVSVDVSVGT